MRRELEAIEEVEGRADDQRVEQRAEPRALAQDGGEHEHDEGHEHRRHAEAQSRVNRDRLVQHVPRPEPDVRPHRQQLAPPVQEQRADERREAHPVAAAQGRVGTGHRDIMAAQRGDMLSLQARQPRGPRGREESPDTKGQGAG